MTQNPDRDNKRGDWHDFLSPTYTGPKFEEAPNRRVRRKQRRAWQRENRRERSSKFIDSVQEQRREEPTSRLTIIVAFVLFALFLLGASWLVTKVLGGDEENDVAPAPAAASSDTATVEPTPTATQPTAAAPTIAAAKPDDLATQWLTAYLTREAPSDDAWQDTVRDHTTDDLMNDVEDTNWPTDSPFSDCDSLALDDLELVDAPRNSPADTDTRWTRVANVTTTCDGETVKVPFRIQVIQDDGEWRVAQAVEMFSENGE